MIQLLEEILLENKVHQPQVSGVTLFQIKNSFSRCPFAYNSEIIILARGSKNVYLGSEIISYDSSNYLVLPIPLPAECSGETIEGKAILGMSITIEPLDISEMLLAMELFPQEPKHVPRGIYSSPLNEPLLESCVRLLKAIQNTQDERILAPLIKKEILYRILQDEKGHVLQSLAENNRKFYIISKVLQRIHKSYNQNFDMQSLAKDNGMSSSKFHSLFKSVTNMSPLQYIKNIRLHKAREFMIQEGLNATLASHKVGYESTSQFNREYKRLFGSTPGKDTLSQREDR